MKTTKVVVLKPHKGLKKKDIYEIADNEVLKYRISKRLVKLYEPVLGQELNAERDEKSKAEAKQKAESKTTKPGK